MSGLFRGRRLESLNKRREALIEDYEAINRQISNALEESQKGKLKRQLEDVNKDIDEVDAKIERFTQRPDPSPLPRPIHRWVWILGVIVVLSIIILVFIYPKISLSVPLISSAADINNKATDLPSIVSASDVTMTEQPAIPICSTPHPQISSSAISGRVSIESLPDVNGCVGLKADRHQFQVSWADIPAGTELWILVYSPVAQLYFPRHCTTIQTPDGGQTCGATLFRTEPYDIIFVLADESANLALRANPNGVSHDNLPVVGLAEKFTVQVDRTE